MCRPGLARPEGAGRAWAAAQARGLARHGPACVGRPGSGPASPLPLLTPPLLPAAPRARPTIPASPSSSYISRTPSAAADLTSPPIPLHRVPYPFPVPTRSPTASGIAESGSSCLLAWLPHRPLATATVPFTRTMDFGVPPQGKAAPMEGASSRSTGSTAGASAAMWASYGRSTLAPSAAPSYGDLFGSAAPAPASTASFDSFKGPTTKPATPSPAPAPAYDDDIFDVVPRLRSSTSSSAALRYDDDLLPSWPPTAAAAAVRARGRSEDLVSSVLSFFPC
ncbi:uncharacterized protein [Miscanthus floridulus]|uniref:uncharacterized protein n=1 Tax=Miscanthus floridulus TaxID=154761 RepID=UPI0034579FB2